MREPGELPAGELSAQERVCVALLFRTLVNHNILRPTFVLLLQ